MVVLCAGLIGIHIDIEGGVVLRIVINWIIVFANFY